MEARNGRPCRTGNDPTFAWNPASLYLKRPPFLDATAPDIADIIGARPLLILGDNVTTDHSPPRGAIPAQHPGRPIPRRQRR